MTPDTLFEIGSVSKTFTATLASYAQVLGRLSLADDHPGTYLPQLAGSAIDQASLLNLATYTAGGLPLQFPPDVTDDGQMQSYFEHWVPDAAPGRGRRYSNPSMGLLGYLAALAMNGTFADLVQDQVFGRLGLSHSYIDVPPEQMDRYAGGYDPSGAPVRVTPGVFDAETYGVKSSASDMLHFVEANLAPDQIEAPMREAVEGTHVGYFGVGDMTQGLGWEQCPYPPSLSRLLADNSTTISSKANPVVPLAPRAPHG